MRLAVHAEWTKLRTVGGPGWLLLTAAALTVALSAAAAGAMTCEWSGCGIDVAKISLTGIQLGRAVIAVLAVLAVGGEYSTGMIRTTLTATPRRTTVLAAKAATVTGLVLASGTVAVLGCVLAGRIILPGHGFTIANGYPPLSLTDGPTLRAAAGSVLYLALIGLLSIGIATVVSDAAVAIGIVLGLLYLFPILIHVVADPSWQRELQQIAPSSAGLAFHRPPPAWTACRCARGPGWRSSPPGRPELCWPVDSSFDCGTRDDVTHRYLTARSTGRSIWMGAFATSSNADAFRRAAQVGHDDVRKVNTGLHRVERVQHARRLHLLPAASARLAGGQGGYVEQRSQLWPLGPGFGH